MGTRSVSSWTQLKTTSEVVIGTLLDAVLSLTPSIFYNLRRTTRLTTFLLLTKVNQGDDPDQLVHHKSDRGQKLL